MRFQLIGVSLALFGTALRRSRIGASVRAGLRCRRGPLRVGSRPLNVGTACEIGRAALPSRNARPRRQPDDQTANANEYQDAGYRPADHLALAHANPGGAGLITNHSSDFVG